MVTFGACSSVKPKNTLVIELPEGESSGTHRANVTVTDKKIYTGGVTDYVVVVPYGTLTANLALAQS